MRCLPLEEWSTSWQVAVNQGYGIRWCCCLVAAKLALAVVETLHCVEAVAIRDCDEVAEVTRLARVEGSLGCGGLETWKN